MKKFFLMLCAFFTGMIIFAKDIKVVEGRPSMNKREGVVEVTFVWEGATFANKHSLKKQWAEKYEQGLMDGESSFIKGFNRKAKKLLMTVSDNKKANYTMKIDFVNFDYFFSAMSAIPGHKHKVWANITMTDKNTKEVVWVVEVEEFVGDRDFVRYDSYTKMMNGLGEIIAQLK